MVTAETFSVGSGANQAPVIMTRPIPANYLTDNNSVAICNHLRHHLHLTNCIHIKNHLHRRPSPVIPETSLKRDLLALQRSRSLRDPSTSPPSWQTPRASGFIGRTYDKDGVLVGGRRSFGIEIQREKENSPFMMSSFSNNKVHSQGKVVSREEEEDEEFGAKNKSQPLPVYGKAKTRRKYHSKKRTTHGPNTPLMTLAEQLQQCSNNTHISHCDKQNARKESIHAESHMSGKGSHRIKRHQRNIKEANGGQDSNSFVAQKSMHCSFCLGGRQDNDELDATQSPRNGCGIPWNWSRIHYRGKSFLDKAGRGLSDGLSDSLEARKTGPSSIIHNQRDAISVAADGSCSAPQSDSHSDSLPLLNDNACASQESVERPFLTRDYSGELGIFASNRNNTQDANVFCKARTKGNSKFRVCHNGRHQSLTQKYMPKTYRDLVGQSLVVQALVNAVQRKRVGLIYVFCGPQGTGKSSCARIFAKSLNCQSDRTKPCDDCISCISYNKGKSRTLVEIGPVGVFDCKAMVEVFAKTKLSTFPSEYKVFIVDDCDKLPANSWSSISKIINQESQNVVFILVTTNLGNLPHIITSRCQKIFFPKLKDTDIIYKLKLIVSKEHLQIDKDALKLIASRSYGSLRDAEMTLDHLSLLGQRISLNLVQELVGLVPDEKLVDLLDLALSANTVNTIKSLREIMEAGVEPLSVMSQLATIITDILAGTYVFTRERVRQSFFCRPVLSKEKMEKLRTALKTLSESEKQLRVSNDKVTWLTASMLQLASDQQYMLPNSSGDTTSFIDSPLPTNTNHIKENKGNELNASVTLGRTHHCREIDRTDGDNKNTDSLDFERIWIAVLQQIQINALKNFMHQEGKLVSINYGVAPTVQLMFSTNINKSKAEKFRGYILQAFESVLCTGVTLEIRSGSWKCPGLDVKTPNNAASTCSIGCSRIRKETAKLKKGKVVKGLPSDFHGKTKNEVIETSASPYMNQQTVCTAQVGKKESEHGWAEESSHHSHHQSIMLPMSSRNDNINPSRCRSLVRRKASLARLLQQQAKGCAQRSGWSRHKALSIAKKIEQENLRMEPKSKNFLCWNTTGYTARKLQDLRSRTRSRARTRQRTKTNPNSLLRLVSCGRCLCARTPR